LASVSCDDGFRASRYCDRTLQLLLRTFFDIIMLRKGPERVPASWLVFAFALALMQLTSFVGASLIDYGDSYSHLLAFISNLLAMSIYAAVLFVSGFANRFLPAVSAIVACGAILGLLFVSSYLLLTPFLGNDIAVIFATLFIFWSVPVEGHIIARAIERDRYLGIAIAMVVFIVQFAFQSAMTGRI